jgi:hypothetical protein
MTDRMRDSEREQFTEALGAWGMSADAITETLEGTAFSLGLVELKPETEKSPPEVAIIVDDRRDDELKELFAWRASSTEADYWPKWDVRQPPLLRVVLGADEQALVRFSFTILKPTELERRYLLSVNAEARLLTMMQIKDSGIWLVPAREIQREAARTEGRPDTYDLRSKSLLVGRVGDPIASVDEALTHVGAPRPLSAEPPMNRAERRAAARKKG